MTSRNERENPLPGPRPKPAGLLSRRSVAIAVMAALGILLAYRGITHRPMTQPPPGVSDDSGLEHNGANGDLETERDDLLSDEMPAEPVFPPSQDDPLLSDTGHAADLIAELVQMKPEGAKFVWSEIENINRQIEELKQLGEAALPAIRDYLLASNPDPRDASGDKAADPLRIALLEALTQIPGRDALDVMAQMVGVTIDPQEIDLLANGLEQRAPRTYRGQIASSARAALGMAVQSDPAAFRNIGHLFSVLLDYGDASVAADLEAVSQEGTAWGDYALMVLSKVPEGHGVRTLISVADELADGTAPGAGRYDIALRMLAQASRQYPEAGDALLRLAQDGKISTPVLVDLASTLGGREMELVTRSFGLTARGRALTHLNTNAPKTWSADEIDQRLALLERLLITHPQPQAVRALQEAQQRLEQWRSRT